jgi:predicted O-methyltransferase YrrM
MPSSLTWQSEERCVVGDIVFQTLPVDLLEMDVPHFSMDGADFLLFKPRPLVERYVELVERLHPQRIFELGIFQGGSTAFLHELARPEVLVAIDERPPRGTVLQDYVSRRGVGKTLRIYDDVDQADRGRLAQIVAQELGDEPLDLVIDDCSHMYKPTGASFNELFPRLRPGGVYVIEDWRWAQDSAEQDEGDELPLARLVFELVHGLMPADGLIMDVTIDADSAAVRRGDAQVDPQDFDISARFTPEARSLLAD